MKKIKLNKKHFFFLGIIFIIALLGFTACSFLIKTHPAKADTPAQCVWVTNMSDSTITKLSSSGAVLGTYPVGTYPMGIAIDNAGNVWVANTNTNANSHLIDGSITKLNSAGAVLGTYPVGDSPSYIAIDEAGNVWSSNLFNTVTKLNSAGTVLGTYPVGTYLNSVLYVGIAIDASGNAWVANAYNNTVTKLSSTGIVLGKFPVGETPVDIAIDASGNVWVANNSSATVTKLNSTGAVLGTYPVGEKPWNITIDASGNIWVTNYASYASSNTITKLSSSGTILGTYPVGEGPWGIAIDASGNVWVANVKSNNITKLSSSGTILGTYPVGETPIDVAISDCSASIETINTPNISLSDATNISDASATLNGKINSTGGENPNVTIYWGTTDGGQNSSSWQNSFTPDSPSQPQSATSFNGNISGLDPGTKYYFSAKAKNSAGTSWPNSSLSFTTTDSTNPIDIIPESPVLSTITISPSTADLTVGGDNQQLSATTSDQFGNPIATFLTWTSDNPAVASVDENGLVTPLSEGTAQITATSDTGITSNQATITVTTAKTISGNNVYGWAWSENIGWINFNSNGITGSAGTIIPGGGGDFDYGVNINDDGTFSGYAWSENIGWIKFDGNYDSSYTKGYPALPYHSVCVNLNGQSTCDGAQDNSVTGWARACSVFASGCSGALNPDRGGWDGWINLGQLLTSPLTMNPLAISSTPDSDGFYEFHNWAWGGSDDSTDTAYNKAVIGWASFNCQEGGGCPKSNNYKVITTFFSEINPKPDVKTINDNPLQSPPPEDDSELSFNYCESNVFFQWKYIDAYSEESRFEFQVSQNADFSDAITYDSGSIQFSSPQNSQSINISANPTPNQLAYNTQYYWRVKVWDSQTPALDSGWIDGASFTTTAHAWPQTSFSYTPSSPVTLVNNKATFKFTDSSTCYGTDNKTVDCVYSWKFGDTSNNTSTDKEPSHTYQSNGSKDISLTATDEDGNSCAISKTIKIINPSNTPQWQEVSPF